MRYISVCSGIEAASVAWQPLGWEAVAFAEIEAFPNAVLAHHFPSVPNLGDISKVDWRPYAGTVDLVVGGTPCQSFSVAGKREGLDGTSGLVREYFRLLEEVQPRWFVWENVPGALSSNGGDDFRFILDQWHKLRYNVSFRILDAQYFGVAQRRRRVFAIGHLGDWKYPAKVLFEPESVRGNTPPSRKERQENPGGVEAGTRKASHWNGGPHPSLSQSHNTGGIGMSDQELFSQGGAGLVQSYFRLRDFGNYVESDKSSALYGDVAGTLSARHDSSPCMDRGQNIVFEPGVMSRDGGHIYEDIAPTLRAEPGDNRPAVYSIAGNTIDRQIQNGGNSAGFQEDISYTLNTIDRHAVAECFPIMMQNAMRKSESAAGGIGIGEHDDPSWTIRADAGHPPCVAECYSFDSLASNSMKSPNPDSGCRKVEVSKTLDTSNGDPSKNQGGIAVVVEPSVTPPITTKWAREGWTAYDETAPLVLKDREGKPGGGKGILIGEDKSFTLSCNQDQALFAPYKEMNYAYAKEGNAPEVLRVLRETIGEEAFVKWGLGMLASLQSSEVLRQALHGKGIRLPAFSCNWVVKCALDCSADSSAWLLQSLRETECEGCPPQGWQPEQQFSRELRAYLSELSQPGPQAERFMQDLWQASEGSGLLQQALHTIQKIRRPDVCESSSVVRRLTPTEAEFLQGFPRNYTDIPFKGKPAPDGARYKALGNSMAVPCMAWIGRRIQMVEEGKL